VTRFCAVNLFPFRVLLSGTLSGNVRRGNNRGICVPALTLASPSIPAENTFHTTLPEGTVPVFCIEQADFAAKIAISGEWIPENEKRA
jgi:hypothetical protein